MCASNSSPPISIHSEAHLVPTNVGVEGRAGPPVIMLLVAGEVCHDEAGRRNKHWRGCLDSAKHEGNSRTCSRNSGM